MAFQNTVNRPHVRFTISLCLLGLAFEYSDSNLVQICEYNICDIRPISSKYKLRILMGKIEISKFACDISTLGIPSSDSSNPTRGSYRNNPCNYAQYPPFS